MMHFRGGSGTCTGLARRTGVAQSAIQTPSSRCAGVLTLRLLLFVVPAWAFMACMGCAMEERIVAVRGGISSLPGAEGKLVRAGPRRSSGATWAATLADSVGELPGRAVEGNELRRRLPDGQIKLYAFSPKDLIGHLRDTLAAGEWELIYSELLSDQLKANYRERGRDPEREAVEYLQRNAQDIRQLLSIIPAGEETPGAHLQKVGRNWYRLSPAGGRNLDLRFSAIEMVVEEGVFRLKMLG